jgi:hypothetical protein
MSQRNQIILLVALGLAVVGILVFQLTRKPVSSPVPVDSSGKSSKTSAAPASTGANNAATGKPAAGKPSTSAKSAASSKNAAAKKGAEEDVQIKKADVNIDELLAGIKEVDFDYEQNRLPRDPLAPLVGKLAHKKDENGEEQPAAPATAVQVMNKIVSGILWDERRPLAVVDNEVVYPGYVYADGITVESIDRDRVTFKVGDSLIQNPLKEF